MDEYLARPTISESSDKSFILHVRNKAFERHESLSYEYRKRSSDS